MDNFFWTNFCTCSETINKFVKKTRSNEFLEGSRSYGNANEGFRTNCRFYTSDGNFSGMFTKPSEVHTYMEFHSHSVGAESGFCVWEYTCLAKTVSRQGHRFTNF